MPLNDRKEMLFNFGAFPDVGFRPAFSLVGEFEPPLAQLLAEELEKVPYFSTADE